MLFKDLLSPARLKMKALLMWAGMWALLLLIGTNMLREYSKQGYYTNGKYHIIVSGVDAKFAGLTITAISSIFLFYFGSLIVIALYRKSRGDLDVIPELVICSKCGTPQYPKDLIAGHCPKCTGNVEDLEGYYERHTKKKTELKILHSQENSQASSIGVNTCIRCGETFSDENLDFLCQFCRSK